MSTMTHSKPVASAARLDIPRYTDLLKQFAPKLIETEKENRLALLAIDSLMAIEERTPEQSALLSLLASLIEQFERKAYPIARSTPREVLEYLIEENGLKQADLAELMGGRSRVSDVLSGKRRISIEQAKKLGERFRVSPALFI